ncbi:hypothetical protein [Hymenobacter crusticola]|uniref:hypothetical protein n=1 Tax=Hymenobacter crusticola TaxID=1770526 RepID=UPI00117A04E5|nr:hypothetical protein [Hymenobacter crusticola]
MTDDNGVFHASAVSIKKLQATSAEVLWLRKVLETPVKDAIYWMCKPIYRDAIVFYNEEDKIISILNVCLECSFMQTEQQEIIEGDDSMYPRLKEFFKSIGHEVEK